MKYLELTYDPPKLTKWQAFWRSGWGKGIAAALFFAATVLALECSLAYPALAGSVWASYGIAFGLTAVTLGVGAGIAGYRSARQGKGFWNGFAEHVHNNWSQEVAITSAIFIVSLGITTAKFAIENAVSKPKHYMQGAVPGTEKLIKLQQGHKLDRFGSLTGRYMTDMGTSIEKLALPPTNNLIKTSLEVVKPITLQTGIVAPQNWGFGILPGGGIQYYVPDGIDMLIQKGFLKIIGN